MNKKVLGKGKNLKIKKGQAVFNNFPLDNKGCRGRRLKIQPEKSDIIGNEDLIQRGKVIGAGPDAFCKVGDTIIFSTDGFDKVVVGEDSFYYVLDTDIFVYEINP